MKIPDIIPLWWKLGAAAALVGLLAAGHTWRVHAAYERGHDAAESERAGRDAVAVVSRATENVKVGEKQDKINVEITKAKNEEIVPVIKRIYVDRVRVGQGVCGPAPAAQAESPGSSDGTTSTTRLVSERTEEDLRVLMVKVEEHLATGRACQAFLERNGLTP